jgi:hypothetical protein
VSGHRRLAQLPTTAIALGLVGAVELAAQQPLTAKAFLPDDHRNVMFVDLAAMRAKGVWDELEVSLLKLALHQIEKGSGMALRAIDRVTLVNEPGETGGDTRQHGGVKRLLVVEGNAALGLPRAMQEDAEAVAIGGHAARARRGELHVNPRPELYVAGHETWVRPVLEGKAGGGAPAPDVMSLLAGSEPLACFVCDVTSPSMKADLLDAAFPATSWPDGDAPTFVCMRVVATGDPDDPHLTVEAIVRHARDGAGVAVTTKAVEALRDRLTAMPALRALKPVLAGMTTKADRGDVVCSLDLGRVRNAIGHVAALGALMFVTPVEVGAEAAAVPLAPVPEPVPPIPPAGGKKR